MGTESPPAGEYDVTVPGGLERDVVVSYLSQFGLNLTAPVSRVIDLQQQVNNLVDISWDSTGSAPWTPGHGVLQRAGREQGQRRDTAC
jgi:hypothetical protein